MPMNTRPSRQCQFCGQKYTKKEHYERHVRTHTQERPYNCAQCTAAFSRRDTLRRHTRALHGSGAQDNITVDDGISHVTPGLLIGSPSNQGGVSATGPSASPNPTDTDILPVLDNFSTAFSTEFNWQWDDDLNLDPSFSMQDLGTYDPGSANPGNPWLPLLPATTALSTSSTYWQPSSQISRQWFTRISSPHLAPNSTSRLRSSSPGEDEEVSREALTGSLQQRVPDTTLPPTDFLNCCIHMFTTRLWPIVPVVHLPTFQPSRANPLLLLSICSLGALAIGSKASLRHGERLFEGIQKAILLSFVPKQISESSALGMLQAAAIGQTFALLSGEPQYLVSAQSFHGTLCVALRTFHDTLASGQASSPSMNSNEAVAGLEWHRWIRLQTTIRLLNVIYIQNGELSAIAQRPAFLRVHPDQVQMAAPDHIFLAKSATEWAGMSSAYASAPTIQYSVFSRCAKLGSFLAEVGHVRFHPSYGVEHDVLRMQAALIECLPCSADAGTLEEIQRLSLLTLWHSCFIALFCDIDSLERVCGRDGSQISEDLMDSVKQNAQGNDATRCIAHAMLILKLLERLRLCEVAAVHVARVAWHAGLVLAAYSVFAHKPHIPQLSDIAIVYPELHFVRSAEYYTEAEWAFMSGELTPVRMKMAAFAICTTLRSLGPWPNAVRYVNTLEQILTMVESG